MEGKGMNRIEEYDHVSGDRDAGGICCDECGASSEKHDVRECAAPGCDRLICCDCRGSSEVHAVLEVCSDQCAVKAIAQLRARAGRAA